MGGRRRGAARSPIAGSPGHRSLTPPGTAILGGAVPTVKTEQFRDPCVTADGERPARLPEPGRGRPPPGRGGPGRAAEPPPLLEVLRAGRRELQRAGGRALGSPGSALRRRRRRSRRGPASGRRNRGCPAEQGVFRGTSPAVHPSRVKTSVRSTSPTTSPRNGTGREPVNPSRVVSCWGMKGLKRATGVTVKRRAVITETQP